MINPTLNHNQIEKIKQSIATAEQNTRSEIVPFIKAAASSYPAAVWRVNIFAILIASMLYRFWPSWQTKSIEMLLVYQALALLLSLLILKVFPRIKLWFVSEAEIQEEIDEAALTAFHKHGVSRTHEHTGVLVAVFMLERRVKILADSGIHQKAHSATWQKIIDQMLSAIQTGDLGQGLAQGIVECGRVLGAHYPPRENNPDELKNRLVIEA